MCIRWWKERKLFNREYEPKKLRESPFHRIVKTVETRDFVYGLAL